MASKRIAEAPVRHAILPFLIAAALIAGITQVPAGDFEDTACYVFGGKVDCRMVKIFDSEECVIKVHPQPLPVLDAAIAACLLDEVETRKIYLRKAQPRNMAVADRIRVEGPGVVEVLVKYGAQGEAVWESRNTDSFEIKGDPALTRKAIEMFASEFCRGQTRMVGGGSTGGVIGVKEAFQRAREGSIILVDIRLPSEWRETGVGENAVPITMHQGIYNFVDKLKKAAGDNELPIALICAEGVRSADMQSRLVEYGFKGVIDVREGMMGSDNGPGWIKSGLPVNHYKPLQAQINE